MGMMTESVVSVAAIVGYNRCHTPRHRIKEPLDVSLGYSNSCGFHILPKLNWCSSGLSIPGQLLFREQTYTIQVRQVHPLVHNRAKWNQVVYSNEPRFNLSSDDIRVRVWRPRGERLNSAFALQRHTAPQLV
ncbi:hypothetical protein TNCV_1027271 [Trichonephila clavipes]|nr:hypothetical protein TNCV_1027271 [Trichonephila clavipes]